MFLYFDLLIVPAGSRLRSPRQTGELVGGAVVRVGAGYRQDEGVELVKVGLRGENVTTLCTHIITLVLQNLGKVEKALTVMKLKTTK